MSDFKENIINVPNALSFYRILALPFISLSIYWQKNDLFILLLSINLITDILDGWIARRYKLQTAFGAKLNSIADIGTYCMAFAGMIHLQSTFVNEHKFLFLSILGMWIIPQLFSLIKFHLFPSLHLWSNKILGYIQGIFIFLLFTIGEVGIYFYFMVIASWLAYLEEFLVLIKLPSLQSNVKSIFLLHPKKKNSL